MYNKIREAANRLADKKVSEYFLNCNLNEITIKNYNKF